MTRIKLNSRPPDWRTGIVIRDGDTQVRTLEARGPVVELETPYGAVRDLVALSHAFGGCRLEDENGRFQTATFCPAVSVVPALEPRLREFVQSTAAKLADERAKQQRVRAAIADIEADGDPLDHEGFDWSD